MALLTVRGSPRWGLPWGRSAVLLGRRPGLEAQRPAPAAQVWLRRGSSPGAPAWLLGPEHHRSVLAGQGVPAVLHLGQSPGTPSAPLASALSPQGLPGGRGGLLGARPLKPLTGFRRTGCDGAFLFGLGLGNRISCAPSSQWLSRPQQSPLVRRCKSLFQGSPLAEWGRGLARQHLKCVQLVSSLQRPRLCHGPCDITDSNRVAACAECPPPRGGLGPRRGSDVGVTKPVSSTPSAVAFTAACPGTGDTLEPSRLSWTKPSKSKGCREDSHEIARVACGESVLDHSGTPTPSSPLSCRASDSIPA